MQNKIEGEEKERIFRTLFKFFFLLLFPCTLQAQYKRNNFIENTFFEITFWETTSNLFNTLQTSEAIELRRRVTWALYNVLLQFVVFQEMKIENELK